MVRVSGPTTSAVVAKVVPEWRGGALEARKVHRVRVTDPSTGEVLDHGLLTWFPAPHSYTGDDVVEFSGHGGTLLARRVLDAFLAGGARQAEGGEFTQRAYLNGKLDLVQAEAVDDLVRGRSRRLQREAVRQLDRHLSRRIAALREDVIEVEALLAYHIDFPDEDEPPVPIDVVRAAADAVLARLEALAETAPEGERLREGALVVLAGRPNAGKSSLYNALAGEERALVTPIPGTTRDALEIELSMDGYPVRLVDTAGLREEGDQVERMGIEVARRFVGSADLVLHCVPATEAVAADDAAWLTARGPRVLRVRTMADLVADGSSGEDRCTDEENGAPDGTPRVGEPGTDAPPDEVRVSVVTGEGLGALRRRVAGLCFAGLHDAPADAPVLTRARQAEAVRRAAAEMRDFSRALGEGVPAEYAAGHLHAAETALEEIVGLVDIDAVLDRVFRSFCVGK